MLKLFVALQTRYMELRDREEGQAFTEYAVILAVVAIVVLASVILFQKSLTAAFTKVTTAVSGL